jgi:hypothetical protein
LSLEKEKERCNVIQDQLNDDYILSDSSEEGGIDELNLPF